MIGSSGRVCHWRIWAADPRFAKARRAGTHVVFAPVMRARLAWILPAVVLLACSGKTTGVVNPDGGGASGDAASCVNVDLSTYDRSCKQASDCVSVTAGEVCTGQCSCGGSFINAGALGRYQQAVAGIEPGTCFCGVGPAPECIDGTCTVGSSIGPGRRGHDEQPPTHHRVRGHRGLEVPPRVQRGLRLRERDPRHHLHRWVRVRRSGDQQRGPGRVRAGDPIGAGGGLPVRGANASSRTSLRAERVHPLLVRIQLARLSRRRVTLVARELPRAVRLEPVEQQVERLRAARRRGGFRLPTLGVGLVEDDRAASTRNVESENDVG